MIRTQLFIAAALLVGVAIGYFAGEPATPPSVEKAATTNAPHAKISDAGDAASVRALRLRVAELERLLAEKEAKSEVAISNAVAEAVKNRPPEPPRGNWRERMEEMKKNDPARYTQMTNRWAQWRRSRSEQARNKIDFLSSIDTSHMSARAKKTHDELQELIAKREGIEAQLQQENLSDDERGKLMHELWSTHGELQRLNGEERKNLLAETAHNLGFEGEDAKEISATIQEVIQATDSGWGGGRHHGGHRGPPPGGQGGGPRGR